MSWWNEIPSLNPVAAWSASDVNLSQVLDQVGVNHLTLSGLLKPQIFPYRRCSGNGNLWPLTTPITLPTEYVLAGFYKIKSNCVLFYSGDSTRNFFLDQEVSGAGYYSRADEAGNGGTSPLGAEFDTYTFVAVVKRSSNSGIYLNGGWNTSNGIPNNWLPNSLGGLGYSYNGSEYNLSVDDEFLSAGVWQGNPTLAELQTLESKVRAGVTPLPVNVSGVSVARGFVDLTQGANYSTPREIAQDLSARRSNIYSRGVGILEGVTTIENVPGARQVRLFSKKTGLLIQETFSDETGRYKFSNIDTADEYFVVAHDYKRIYNAVVQDMLAP
jgi:hypothetical protein